MKDTKKIKKLVLPPPPKQTPEQKAAHEAFADSISEQMVKSLNAEATKSEKA